MEIKVVRVFEYTLIYSRELFRAFLTLRVAIEYGFLSLTHKLPPVGGDSRAANADIIIGHLQLRIERYNGEDNL